MPELNKKEVNDEILEWFDHLGEEDGSCFGYSEVYGQSNNQEFLFEFLDKKYFVDDQYCTNPICKCDDVILTFYEIIPSKEIQDRLFAVRMSLRTGKYDVEISNTGKDEVENILTGYMEYLNNDLSLLKSRYKKMKEFGNKRIMRKKQNQDIQKAVSGKVGRNDACPCGSGKKYKKCCGNV